MIIGLGVDLCDIARIERTVERFGERFLLRLYTEGERARAARRPAKRADRLAQMFAAKEACSKALGTGFRKGVFWRDMEVVPLRSGKPTLVLHGGARARMLSLIPDGYAPLVDVSLTDESGLAQATVILSAVPEGERAAFEAKRVL
ncbi:holo-ACP synthase [Marivibrio halodurans]|uniref:Holo-[acyl-carrier-protein] synthase n=1 Tax=Marivibrio halodurans TaxID=2039722 RepID=A0A8J7V124_9PROT|nr:holo-ACP synthase [Marivibrio halodurans]MBP5855870.1 holo-ACP synthase [Marivibrio halodurans]